LILLSFLLIVLDLAFFALIFYLILILDLIAFSAFILRFLLSLIFCLVIAVLICGIDWVIRNLVVSIYIKKFLNDSLPTGRQASPFIKGRLRGISSSRFGSKINLTLLNKTVFIER